MTTTEHPTKERAETLQAEATILDIPVQVKEIVKEWMLITYDIPVTAEGNQARAEFLSVAPRIGAVQHTESVYYIPWTQQADLSAMKLSSVGKVYIWYAQTDEETSKKLTVHYDNHVSNWIDDLDERIGRISAHVDNGHLKLADRMMERTATMLVELDTTVNARGSQRLINELAQVKRAIEVVLAKMMRAQWRGMTTAMAK